MDLLEDELGKSPRNTLKFKLDVKIPHTQVDDEISNKKSSRPLKNADKVNFNVLILNDKLQEDKKRKKSNSDTITVDYSSIDSVSANSTNPSSKLHSFRSKTSRRVVNNKALARERRTKASTKIGKERTSDKSSDKSFSVSGGHTSRDNSLATKRARVSKKSNSLSEYLDLKEHLLKMQVIARRKKLETNFDQKSWHSNGTISLSDNSIIEESIDTIIDDSDIISELSRVDKNVAVKVEASTNVSQNSGHPEAEDVSVTVVEYSENSYVVAESGYANDTFEEISSSTAPSKSKFQDEKVTSEKKYNSDNEKVDMDLLPKSYATETDLESASYVSDLGKIGTDLDNMTTQLIKSSNFTDLHLEEQNKHSQQPTNLKKNSPGNKFNKITRTNS